MITLQNGHKLDFACASGALGWIGDGYWWERPLCWFGIIRPDEITIISKTLTFEPRRGNLRMWCPWRCVRLIPGGAVNAVGLTNPGYRWWIDTFTGRLEMMHRRMVIASILPETADEAAIMARHLSEVPLVGIQVNLSCPNVAFASAQQAEHACELAQAVIDHSSHPVIVKLGVQQPYLEICQALDGKIDAVELINTVPWDMMYPNQPSPLARYNLLGGVSGGPITGYARGALELVKRAGVTTPVISGGGISSVGEVFLRQELGADAFALGTVFLREPWLPARIVRTCRSHWQQTS